MFLAGSSLVVQWVKNLVISLLWLRNFYMPQAQQKKKKTKKTKRNKKQFLQSKCPKTGHCLPHGRSGRPAAAE